MAQGLRPDHALVDIGCGALRGGVHFVRYLERGRYHGLVDGDFDLPRFGRTFDYGIAVSVFTHLFLNHIARSLRQMRAVMHEGSRFFCTFFEAPSPVHLAPILHTPGRALTRYDADPFHYAFSELEWLARRCGLRAELIGAWNHPRDQRMVCFTRASA